MPGVIMNAARWARAVGAQDALWRLGAAVRSRVARADVSWSSTHYITRQAWVNALQGTWPGEVAERMRSAHCAFTCEPPSFGEVSMYESSWRVNAGADWLRGWPLVRTHKLWAKARELGDIKDVWEIGRVSCVMDWIRWRAVHGESIGVARQLAIQLNSFEIQHASQHLGPHFASGQECALRTARWCLALAVVVMDEGFDERDFECAQRVLRAHGVWIARHIEFAVRAVPNNHVIAEAMALKMLATCFPHWPERDAWLALTHTILREHVARQFDQGGGYCQASHNYQRFATELLVWWWALSDDHSERELLATLCKKSALYLVDFMVDESCGVLPNFGANDGARWMPFGDYTDFRPALEIAQGLEADGQTSWFPDHAHSQEAAFFIHGERPQHRVAYPRSAFRGRRDLSVQRRAGWQAFLRHGEPWGTASQLDFGHVDLWRDGACVVGDCGSYRYQGDGFEAHAGLEAHNLLTFPDEDFTVARVGRFRIAGELDAAYGRQWYLHRGWPSVARGRCRREISCEDAEVVVRDEMMMRGTPVPGVLRWHVFWGTRRLRDAMAISGFFAMRQAENLL